MVNWRYLFESMRRHGNDQRPTIRPSSNNIQDSLSDFRESNERRDKDLLNLHRGSEIEKQDFHDNIVLDRELDKEKKRELIRELSEELNRDETRQSNNELNRDLSKELNDSPESLHNLEGLTDEKISNDLITNKLGGNALDSGIPSETPDDVGRILSDQKDYTKLGSEHGAIRKFNFNHKKEPISNLFRNIKRPLTKNKDDHMTNENQVGEDSYNGKETNLLSSKPTDNEDLQAIRDLKDNKTRSAWSKFKAYQKKVKNKVENQLKKHAGIDLKEGKLDLSVPLEKAAKIAAKSYIAPYAEIIREVTE